MAMTGVRFLVGDGEGADGGAVPEGLVLALVVVDGVGGGVTLLRARSLLLIVWNCQMTRERA